MATTRQRILELIENQNIKKSDFLEKTGLKKGYVDKAHIESSMSDVAISKILEAFPVVSPEWLVTGIGPMLRNSDNLVSQSSKNVEGYKTGSEGIPLISRLAAAGFGNEDFRIEELDIKDRYVVPKFRSRKVDFMIEVTGSSMYPKYRSGDVIACTILHERKFIQWNKVHLIGAREQGLLLKRLRPAHDEDHITAVSDHKDYPPFDIPKSEIEGLALVVGTIRLE